MSSFGTPQPSAFTVRYNSRSLRLITEVEIFPAHGPGSPSPRGQRFQALYDTGATHSAVSPAVVQALGLVSIGARVVGVGGGQLSTTSHLVNIALPNRVMFPGVNVAKMVLLGGIDALIGMDILGNGDFAVTHKNNTTTFSFCCPSQHDVDFASSIQKSVPGTKLMTAPFTPGTTGPMPAAKPSVPIGGRNAPCTCGSGKKYKKCHGAP